MLTIRIVLVQKSKELRIKLLKNSKTFNVGLILAFISLVNIKSTISLHQKNIHKLSNQSQYLSKLCKEPPKIDPIADLY